MVSAKGLFPCEEVAAHKITQGTLPFKYCTIALSDVVSREKRLDASVFDVEAKEARRIIEHGKYPTRMICGLDGLAKSYMGSRFKHIPVRKSEYPIFQPSSITHIFPAPSGYISHLTQTDIDALRVHTGQVLITRSGTIGKVAYVGKTLDNKILSDDLLRLDSKDPHDAGYIYAYLKSTIGNRILLTNAYGAVITHIEPQHFDTVPIPDPPVTIKRRIHALVENSTKLLDISNALIVDARNLMLDALHLPDFHDFINTHPNNTGDLCSFSTKLSSLKTRLDATCHNPLANSISEHLSGYAQEVIPIGDRRIDSRIFLPTRFKRIYVKKGHGIPFFSGRSIHDLDPADKHYLSFKQHGKKIEDELVLSENMILITCSGTIGEVVLVPKHWHGWAMTHDIIRCILDPRIAGYVYIWLSSEYARFILKSKSYGAVVQHIEIEHLHQIPVPFLSDKSLQDHINHMALAANKKRYKAYLMIQEAIEILEQDVIYAN